MRSLANEYRKPPMEKHTHVGVSSSSRRALPGSRALRRTNPHTTFDVLLKLRRQTGLPEPTAGSPLRMSRQGLGATYGSSPEDVDAVVRAFRQFGLRVVTTSPETRSVQLAGSVSQMENAFQVRLFDYEHASGNYRGHIGEAYVPAEVGAIVQGVFGLDDRRVARRRDQVVRRMSTARSLTSVPDSWYTPRQLAEHYSFPPGDGSGQSIGILEFGGGYFPADLQQFCEIVGVDVPKVVAISTDGTATNARDGEESEVMLDIEVVAGVCPKATIVVYFADFTEKGWITALDAVLQDKANNPGVLSISWGLAEDVDVWSSQAMSQVNEALKEAAFLGVTVCVAAGDDGSSDAITADGLAHADFPASSPYVLAVGGTTIPVKGGKQADVCWHEGDGLRNDRGGSTGGGVSAVFPRPAWQNDLGIRSVNPRAILGRCIPDLAANADWNVSPYLLVVDGRAQPNGGTSAATPLVASLMALINAQRGVGNQVGYLTPLLYQSASTAGATLGALGCTDVISGNNVTALNGGYSAAQGYDAVSGWGTPNGVALMKALSAFKV